MSSSTGYQIKDIAARSGFSAATLRYYEQVGLLPKPRRTDAGYRVYDDQVLDRLAFIGRAKQLGCSLGEIGELTTAWDGGRCGPIQDRLRTAVAGKLSETDQQLGELAAFRVQLERAAADLERHRPDGSCDDRCGCVAPDSATASEPLDAPHTVATSTAIACTLDPGELHGRVEDWQRLLTHSAHHEPIDSGRRITFDQDVPLHDLIDLVGAEQSCCQFFAFAITVDARGTALEVTAPADAVDLVDDLFAPAP